MSSFNDPINNLPFDPDNPLQDIEAAEQTAKADASASEDAFLAYAHDAQSGMSDDPLPELGPEHRSAEPQQPVSSVVPASTQEDASQSQVVKPVSAPQQVPAAIPLQDIEVPSRPAASLPPIQTETEPLTLTSEGMIVTPPVTSAEKVARQKAIRTYQSDIAETMHGKQVSLADIALAEQRKQQEGTEPKPRPEGLVVPPRPLATTAQTEEELVTEEKAGLKGMLTVFGGVLLLSVAAGVLLFVYGAYRVNRTPVVVTEAVPDVGIVVESVSVIPVELGTSRSDLLASFTAAVDETGGVRDDVVGIVYQTGTSSRLTAKQFIEILDTSAEDRLVRTLLDTFIVGVHITDAEHGFLVFTTSIFENAFAGMLAWEETILNDMPFVRNTTIIDESALEIVVPNATTTSTTTDATVVVPQDPLFGAEFRDVVVNNKNARALFTQRGEIVLIYSFSDTETLVITSNIDTLQVLLDRLAATRFSR